MIVFQHEFEQRTSFENPSHQQSHHNRTTASWQAAEPHPHACVRLLLLLVLAPLPAAAAEPVIQLHRLFANNPHDSGRLLQQQLLLPHLVKQHHQ
jgi:hypothetical protein